MPPIGHKCPKCESELSYKKGRYGVFIGCSAYPDCKHIESLKKPKETGIQCVACHTGSIVERRSRRGTNFYSCSRYPECKQAYSALPVMRSCPECQSSIMLLKDSKRIGKHFSCANKECNYKESVDKD